MRQLIVAAAGLQGARAAVQGEQFNTLPFLGDHAILGIARVLHLFPAARLPSLLAQAFPFELTVDKSEAEGVHALLAKLGMSLDGAAREPYHLASTQQLRSGVALVRLACGVGAPAIWFRQHLAGRLWFPKHGDADEFPLTRAEVAELRRRFDVDITYPELALFRLASYYVFKNRVLPGTFTWLDQALYRVPAMRPFSYYQYLYLTRP